MEPLLNCKRQMKSEKNSTVDSLLFDLLSIKMFIHNYHDINTFDLLIQYKCFDFGLNNINR